MSRTDDTYLRQLRARYRAASKKEKSRILDEFVKTTGYLCKQASAVLNGGRERVRGPIRRPRRAQYGAEKANALAILTDFSDDICSIRLRASLDVEVPPLYEGSVLRISPTCYENLLQVSSATMDRLRARFGRRPRRRRGSLRRFPLLEAGRRACLPAKDWHWCRRDLSDRGS